MGAARATNVRVDLPRMLGIAALVVVLSGSLFALVGAVRSGDGGLASPPPTPPATTDPEPDEPDGEDPGEGTDEPGNGEEPDGGAEPTEPTEPDPGEPPTEPEPTEPEPPASTVDPSTVTVQVLDGYRQDGGTAAGQVTADLRAAGFRVVAENPAIPYEVTTVLWNEGYEEEGRAVAAAIDAPEIRVQPGNLSAQVQVHVVVGADRAG